MLHSRTYRSAKATEKRLHHAQAMCLRFRQLTQRYALEQAGEAEIVSRAPPTRCRSE
jgi:hypothetical protein